MEPDLPIAQKVRAIKEPAEALPALPTVLMTARDEQPSAGPVAVKRRKAIPVVGETQESSQTLTVHVPPPPDSILPETFLNTEDNAGQSSKSLRFVMQ